MNRSNRHLRAIKRIGPNLALMVFLIAGVVAANIDASFREMGRVFFGDGLYLLYLLMAANVLIGAITYWISLDMQDTNTPHKN